MGKEISHVQKLHIYQYIIYYMYNQQMYNIHCVDVISIIKNADAIKSSRSTKVLQLKRDVKVDKSIQRLHFPSLVYLLYYYSSCRRQVHLIIPQVTVMNVSNLNSMINHCTYASCDVKRFYAEMTVCQTIFLKIFYFSISSTEFQRLN